MHVKDLTDNYFDFVLDQKNPDAYVASDPSLFEHYFSYWASRERGFSKYPVNEIKTASLRIKAKLPFIEQRLAQAGISTDGIDFVLFVGKGTANGHAFPLDGRMVVWIPVETYQTGMQVEVFVTHEIVHGIHYALQPDFFFATPFQKRHVGRQILTEGVATFVTRAVLRCSLEVALWADFLGSTEMTAWLNECHRRSNELRRFVGAHWDDTQGPATELFLANDSTDILRNRAGYFIGEALIADFTAQQYLDAKGLLAVSKPELETWCRKRLETSL